MLIYQVMTKVDPSTCLLIIVNYNQIHELPAVLKQVEKFHPKKDTVVVDDGSSDNSWTFAKDEGFRLVRHSRNQGVGAAIRTGILFGIENRYESVVIIAGNGKMFPSDIPRVIQPILENRADFVQGSRYLEGGGSPSLTLFRKIAIPIFTFTMGLLVQKRFSDITCGFRAYRLSLFENPRFKISQSWLDKYELEFYILYWAVKLKYRIQEVGVHMHYSHLQSGRVSKIKPIVGWWSMIRPFLFLKLRLKN